MLGALAISFLAGALSILSPCVLPLLPLLLSGALQQHALAPLALAGGLAASFTTVGLLLATFGFAAGIDGEALRVAAGVLMGLLGILMLSSKMQLGFARFASPLAGTVNGLLTQRAGLENSDRLISGFSA